MVGDTAYVQHTSASKSGKKKRKLCCRCTKGPSPNSSGRTATPGPLMQECKIGSVCRECVTLCDCHLAPFSPSHTQKGTHHIVYPVNKDKRQQQQQKSTHHTGLSSSHRICLCLQVAHPFRLLLWARRLRMGWPAEFILSVV